jgi:enoyl-CoA hydratase/carnithine racemase
LILNNFMAYQTLQLEKSPDGLMQVTLNRPETRNALNTQMGIELREIFAPLAFHPQDVRCVLITGSGDKAFCAGGDLKERNGMSDEQWRMQHAIFEEAYYAVMNCTTPVLAAVNGSAFGGGCELALACDFIYASSTARFGLPETTLGILPGCGGTQNLPRAVGERRAKELILMGKPFTAQGHGQPRIRTRRADARRTRSGTRDVRQRAGVAAPGQDRDSPRTRCRSAHGAGD